MTRLDAVLREARSQLSDALALEPEVAALEAHVLLGEVLNKSRAYLLAHPEAELDDTRLAPFTSLINRRLQGEPIAYILRRREFFGLEFEVTPDVLIPRSDTEILVELALALIAENDERQVLDLGTGSGAIAITIAKLRPKTNVTAIDQSDKALLVAKENARKLGTKNIQFLQSDWFAALDENVRFDLIVANPPYIANNDIHLSQGDLRFEPPAALASGAEGLDAIRNIASKAIQHLTPQGRLLLEHGFTQGADCRSILTENNFTQIASYRDLAGLERVTVGCPPTAKP